MKLLNIEQTKQASGASQEAAARNCRIVCNGYPPKPEYLCDIPHHVMGLYGPTFSYKTDLVSKEFAYQSDPKKMNLYYKEPCKIFGSKS